MTEDSVFQYFKEEEVTEFNNMLKRYIYRYLMKIMLKELSSLYGELTQAHFWRITSSEIWKAICRKYGSEIANKSLKEFLQVCLFDGQVLISALESVIYQEITEKVDDLWKFIDERVNVTNFENQIKGVKKRYEG